MKMKKAAKKYSPKIDKDPKKKSPPKLGATPLKYWLNESGTVKAVVDPQINSGEVAQHITGTKDFDLAIDLLKSPIANMISHYPTDEEKTEAYNLIAQSLYDMKPRDSFEARLITQATVLHKSAMQNLMLSNRAERIDYCTQHMNMAVKLFKLHNETVEALSRYRRGGEQKVTVTHAVLANNAIVNNFTSRGVGSVPKGEGTIPCSESAEPKQEPMKVSHVVSQPWQMDAVGCMVESAQAPRQ